MTWGWPLASLHVRARPESGLWTFAHVEVDDNVALRITAGGTWRYSDSCSATPDGDQASLLHRSFMLYGGAPVAALIGKVGGSTAGWNDGVPFLAGSFAIVEVAHGGPLFFTINDEYNGMANNHGTLCVTVWSRPVAPRPAESEPPASTAK